MTPPFQLYGLHQAALKGDVHGVRHALRSGASVNDLDSTGRTAVMCAVAGENWESIDASNASHATPGQLDVVRTLLADPEISLFTLNAPQMAYRGVTPLGMAAWLNSGDVVRVLLEESAEYVSVDGLDGFGATPLMYAARDGRLDVVQILLRHGARPDFGDGNHRTSVQFALDYPQIEWLCETALRRHRWLESQSPDRNRIASNPGSEHLLHIASAALAPSRIFEPPLLSVFSGASTSRLTDTIIQSITTCDVAFLHSLLFSPSIPACSQPELYPMSAPVLVNLPATKGWSPIHYCAAAESPSVDVLDALYCAGAVVSLFTTTEQWTPLHCFAQAARRLPRDRPDLCVALYQFVAHLVHDLGAPLAARDRDDETCIHVAAEHGTCIETLVLLLECDTSRAVRELRNARGLTALDVCKPEFRAAFGQQLEDLRSDSSLSSYTIRPATSMTSLSTWSSQEDPSYSDETSVLDNVDISASAEQLLANLRLTSPTESHQATPFHLNFLDNLVHEAADITAIVAAHYRTVATEAAKDAQLLRANADKMQLLLDRTHRDVEQAMQARGVAPLVPRKRFNRDSEDSQATAVSVESPDGAAPWSALRGNSVLNEKGTAEGLEGPYRLSVEHLIKDAMGDELVQPVHLMQLADVPVDLGASPLKSIKKKSGATKLRAWMKRKLLPLEVSAIELKSVAPPPTPPKAPRPKLEVILEQQVQTMKPIFAPHRPHLADPDLSADAWMDGLLQTSHATLQAAGHDLDRIRECVASAEHFITIVDRCAARAERVIDRALKKRTTAIANLRLTSNIASPDDFFVPPSLSLKSSIASLSSVYSARSSCVSLAATLAEQEDDDIRVVRRLLLRKIDTGASGAHEQLQRGVSWLRSVKEVVRSAKRKAYV
ncbi:hypothetical protein B0H15DRAFT_845590 [Mycena belliarum]|uniref:Ankyrin n=1 Tax=Mycena belliarum TaxID=1033014 RepID=A0AAD6U204_9AGAR|nr:hypothetical protein B0H15DRAFT_845590 [Mycena belliae]